MQKLCFFYRADFARRTILRANFRKRVGFNEAVFRDGVIFAGWRNITFRPSSLSLRLTVGMDAIISGGRKPTLVERIRIQARRARNAISRFAKRLQEMALAAAKRTRNQFRGLHRRFAKTDPDAQIFRMFEDEGHLERVVFLKPDQTLFSEVDLSKVHFRGTNLRGVRFLGVTWWQPTLRRNGLYDEVYIKLSKDGPFRYSLLPVLEETCRNARVALEENRNFNVGFLCCRDGVCSSATQFLEPPHFQCNCVIPKC